jgi:hypothetical protein
MPENATVYRTTQFGVEATPGVVVAGTKRFLCTQLDPNPVTPLEVYRPAGMVAPSEVIAGKEHTEGEFSGALCPNDLVYVLNSLLLTGTITTPSGFTGSARRHTFLPATFAPDSFKTYTIEKGSSAGAERFTHCVFNNLTMRWTTAAEAAINGNIFGQRLYETGTGGFTGMTSSPTDLAAAVIDPKNVSIFVGSTTATNEVQTLAINGATGTFTLTYEGQTTGAQAVAVTTANLQTALEGLSTIGAGNVAVSGTAGTSYTITFQGALAGIDASTLVVANSAGGPSTITVTTPGGLTRLTRATEFEFVVPDRYVMGMTLNAATDSFDYVVQQGVEPTAQIVMMHDAASIAFMADLRAKTKRYCRVVATGADIVTGVPYRVVLTFAFKFVNSDRGDQDSVHAATYDLRPIYDSTLGGWCQFVVDCNITAL